MLKSRTLTLTGRDAGTTITLTELPALAADRYARVALAAIGADPEGGIVRLTLTHLDAVRRLGSNGLALLQPFVQADKPLAALKDWHNVRVLQNTALLLHVDFMATRAPIEVPIRIQAMMIERGIEPVAPSFCSAQIAAVLLSDKATYRELETVLSTEDVFNLVELLNIDALRRLSSQGKKATP